MFRGFRSRQFSHPVLTPAAALLIVIIGLLWQPTGFGAPPSSSLIDPEAAALTPWVATATAPPPAPQPIPTAQRARLVHHPKLLGAATVLAAFDQGLATSPVIVSLQPGAEAETLADLSRLSTRARSTADQSPVTRNYDLLDPLIRENLRASVSQALDLALVSLDVPGLTITWRFNYLYGFAAQVTAPALERLLTHPRVRRVEPDRPLSVLALPTLDPHAAGTATTGATSGAMLPPESTAPVPIPLAEGTRPPTMATLISQWESLIDRLDADGDLPPPVLATGLGGQVAQVPGPCDAQLPTLAQAAVNARAAGISLFAPAGDEGDCTALSWPACLSAVNAVGAVYAVDQGLVGWCVNAASCADKTPDHDCASGYLALEEAVVDQVPAASNSTSGLALLAPADLALTQEGTEGTPAATAAALVAATVLQEQAWDRTGTYLSPAEVSSILRDSGVPIRDAKSGVITPRIDSSQSLAFLADLLVGNLTSPQGLVRDATTRIDRAPLSELTSTPDALATTALGADIAAATGNLSSCPPDEHVDLADQYVTDSRRYQACKSLAAGPFSLGSTAKVTFEAGQRITLRSGFRVERGAIVSARILPDLQLTPDAEIRAVQLAGADGNNRYDLFVGQTLTTGSAQVDFSEGLLKTLGFTLLSGPAGFSVNAQTGAIRYQPPPTVTPGSYPFLIRVTHSTSTLEVTGNLQLTLAQQVDTATADGVTPIGLGDHLVTIDGNALPAGTAVSLSTGSTVEGERFIALTVPAPLAEGTSLRFDLSKLAGTAQTAEGGQGAGEVAGLDGVDEDCSEYAPRRWQRHFGFFFEFMYRWPPRLVAEGFEIPWWAINPMIGSHYELRSYERVASVLCSEYALGSKELQTDAQPVLLVHGYTAMNKLGGLSGTWGSMVPNLKILMGATASEPKILPFEFRWRTNARFEDVAAELKEAIDEIKRSTGKNVHIVAHSFGGLLVRTYLQGLADVDSAYSTPVASLTTIGTPHSGIFTSSSDDYPDGTDQSVGGATILGCLQLSCIQAGLKLDGLGILKSVVELFLGTEEYGTIIRDLKDGKHPFLSPDLPVQVLIGLRTWVKTSLLPIQSTKITFTDGDGLISFDGQRFLPKDGNQQKLRRMEQITGLGANVSEYVISRVCDQESDLEGRVIDESGIAATLPTQVSALSLFPGFSHTSYYLDDDKYDGVRAKKTEVGVDNGDHEVLPHLLNWINSSYLFSPVEASPSSGNWTDSPHDLKLHSCSAKTIYYSMVNTYDGSTPADPVAPTPSANNGSLAGSDPTFTLFGNPGQIKKIKLRFVGCKDNICGPVSGTYVYTIDLRGSVPLPINVDCPAGNTNITDVNFGSVVRGNLATGGSCKFRITVAQASDYVFFSRGITDTYARLYDANNALLTQDGSSGEGGNNFRIARNLNPGTYYLEVTGSSFATGAYDLHLEGPGAVTVTDDHGASRWSATPVSIGSVTGGVIDVYQDHDYFRFVITQASDYVFFSRGITDTYARLYDANNTLLTQDGSSGEGGNNFRIAPNLNPGTYYLEVTGSSFATGAYDLHLEGPGAVTVTDDHGASRWSATPVMICGITQY